MTGSPSRIPRLPRPWRRADSVARDAAAAAPETRAGGLHLPRFGRLACVFVGLALAGCTDTGDFGRPRPSLWNEVILPAAGSHAALARGEPVSRYVYTDDEDELRDRAWRFVMPAHERSWFEGIVANLVRTRVLPLHLQPADRTTYHHALMGGSFRSPASRYRRLSEDAVADLLLIGPFTALAARVIAADRVRLRSLAHVRDLDEAQVHHAVARVAENRCLIAWVRVETLGRLESYRYALEHLLIEAPQNEAMAAERSLAKLGAYRQMLDTLVAPPLPHGLCAGADDVLLVEARPPAPPVGIEPRREPLVVKD
jgi:hypothetical protein